MDNNKTNIQAQEEPNALSAIKANKSKLIAGSIIIVVCCVVAIVWYIIAMNGARKADEAIALADTEMNDSIALAKYIDASKLGYKSGNRAAINAGIQLYRDGKYEEAIKYLNDASVSSEPIEAGRYTLMGDCYVNLQKYDDAIKCYNKALKEADGNSEICPFILIKEANVYRETGMFDSEYSAYKAIIDKYPTYVQSLKQRNVDIRKYAERAKAAAGK